ncbi:MAG: NADH-quinone oxidoreductase subunit J [Actinobacteria bacterium]|nr:NADH-quinone oxidoreductase subunit J [Actinomycetota bacterium]
MDGVGRRGACRAAARGRGRGDPAAGHDRSPGSHPVGARAGRVRGVGRRGARGRPVGARRGRHRRADGDRGVRRRRGVGDRRHLPARLGAERAAAADRGLPVRRRRAVVRAVEHVRADRRRDPRRVNVDRRDRRVPGRAVERHPAAAGPAAVPDRRRGRDLPRTARRGRLDRPRRWRRGRGQRNAAPCLVGRAGGHADRLLRRIRGRVPRRLARPGAAGGGVDGAQDRRRRHRARWRAACDRAGQPRAVRAVGVDCAAAAGLSRPGHRGDGVAVTGVDVAFWVFALAAVWSGYRVFRTDSMVRASFLLLASFLNVGAILVLLLAEYLGTALLFMMTVEMVVMALFMVMFMMNPAGLNPMEMVHQPRLAAVAGVVTTAGLGLVAVVVDFPDAPVDPAAETIRALGTELLGGSMLVFESAGVTLLATMVCAVILSAARGRYGDGTAGSVAPPLEPGGDHRPEDDLVGDGGGGHHHHGGH